MGFREDQIEFKGSEFEKWLLRKEETGTTGYWVKDASGREGAQQLAPQSGEYYEVMPDGEVRYYRNGPSDKYERVRQLKRQRR